MKKQILAAFAACVMFLGAAAPGYAALTRMGDFVYDDIARQYWIADLNRFLYMSYEEQLTAIVNLTDQAPGTIGGWRMAGLADIANLMAQPIESIDDWGDYFTPTQWGVLDNGLNKFIQGRIESLAAGGYPFSFVIRTIAPLPETNVEFLITPKPYIRGFGPPYERDLDLGTPYYTNMGAWAVADVIPTPVPSTLWLLVSGAGCLCLALRKKRATNIQHPK